MADRDDEPQTRPVGDADWAWTEPALVRHRAREALTVARGRTQLAERLLRGGAPLAGERALHSLAISRQALDRLHLLLDRHL